MGQCDAAGDNGDFFECLPQQFYNISLFKNETILSIYRPI